jgi:uncharacterized protein (TIGR04255 family)
MIDPFFVSPSFQRCVYESNPLALVTAEVRFPAVLKLKNEAPADFQERIAEKFPQVESREQTDIGIDLASSDKPKISKSELYVFGSLLGDWSISVTSRAFSLTTSSYKNWEQFEAEFNSALHAFLRCYSAVKVVNRVGLRYQNIIDKKALGLSDRKWSELIHPHAGGMLVVPGLDTENLQTLENTSQMKFGERSITIRHQVVTDANDTQNRALLLDADFFVEAPTGVESSSIPEKLDQLHKLSGPLFRWSITDVLHEHLKPTKVP